jgi:hypothetical protein
MDQRFKTINDLIKEARTKAGEDRGNRALVEAVQALADEVRELKRKKTVTER